MSDTSINPKNINIANSQCKSFAEHLKEGNKITGLMASVKFGVMHLPRRIKDLKEKGFPISSNYVEVMKSNGKITHVKEYFIQEEYATYAKS